MRVLILDTYYPALLDRHYSNQSGLAETDYAAQLESLMALGFGTSDAYSRCLNENSVPAADLIVNCAPLQQAWAREHGIRPGSAAMKIRRLPRIAARLSSRSSTRVVAAQIEEFKPDVLYLQALNALPTSELRRQRELGRLVVGQIASALPSDSIVQGFDLILTSFPHFVERIRARGVSSEFFPIAFDAKVLERLSQAGADASPDSKRDLDVSFVGGVNPSVHREGTDFLARLSDRMPVDVWGYGADALPPDSPILRRHHGEAWGMDMYRIFASSKIAINRHIDSAEGYSNNMRLFEATGVGALLFTESSRNLGDFFEPESEVIAYDDLDDLADKINHYLGSPEERLRIATAGHEKTMAHHTYQRRIPELVEILEAQV